MQASYFPNSLVFVLTLSFASAATACKSEASASAKATATVTSSMISAPSTDNLDGAVTHALERVKDCKRTESGALTDACDAMKELSAFEDTYVEGDENDVKRAKLARACLASIADPNDNIREAAAECVADRADHIDIDPASKRFVLQKCAAEKVPAVRSAIAGSLSVLHPGDAGMDSDVIALAKKMRDEKAPTAIISSLADAMQLQNEDISSAAVDFGLELLTSPNLEYREEGTSLLKHSKARAKDACKGLAQLVGTMKFPWASGIDAMASMGLSCQDDLEPVVSAVVERMGEPEGYDKGFFGPDVIYLERALDARLFSPAQRAKLKSAAQAEAKTKPKGAQRDELDKLVAEL